jgi:hypothetical protein
MDTTGAMMLSFPKPMVANAMPAESNTPRLGFAFGPEPLPKDQI